METLTIELEANLANKVKKYFNHYENKDIIFDNFVEFEIKKIKRGIARIQIELDKYEKIYGLKTEDFYQKFENGEFGDETDFMLWSGIYEMYLRELQELKQIEC